MEIMALWSGTNKNRDVSTGPLAPPFARSLAPLSRLLAHSLAHFAHSFADGKVNDWMTFFLYFFLFWTIVLSKEGGQTSLTDFHVKLSEHVTLDLIQNRIWDGHLCRLISVHLISMIFVIGRFVFH